MTVSSTTEPSARVEGTCVTMTDGAGVIRVSVNDTDDELEDEDGDADEVGEPIWPPALLEHEA